MGCTPPLLCFNIVCWSWIAEWDSQCPIHTHKAKYWQLNTMAPNLLGQGTVINITNDETEEVYASILAANKAYYSLHTTFRCKQIHWNNKIRLYKTLMKQVLCYWSLTWTTNAMYVGKEVLPRIYCRIKDGHWRLRWNSEI
jgi:hypothetical protein